MRRDVQVRVAGSILLLIALVVFAGFRQAASGMPLQRQFSLRSCVLGGAGVPGSSHGVFTNGTLGQPQPIGRGASADIVHIAGFWATVISLGPAADVPTPVVWTNDLRPNFPNPFASSTGIAFSSASQENVSLIVYDLRGARVRALVEQELVPGFHRIVWDGTDDQAERVAAGLYFCRLRVGDFHAVKKMVLVK